MKSLFSPEGIRMLEALSFTDALFAFDFDGTLAPICDDPGEARMAERTEALLRELSARVPIAIVSGRSLADLSGRVPVRASYLIGNHGLEGLPGATAISELKSRCAGWKAAISIALAQEPDPGIRLEDKGLSLAIHYRASRRKKSARARILKALGPLEEEARILAGKQVFNVVPVGGPHKGMALARVMAHSGAKAAFFIGDDHTDEDVFGMPGLRVLSVRVGRKAGSQAQYYIRQQSEIDLLLRELNGFHSIGS